MLLRARELRIYSAIVTLWIGVAGVITFIGDQEVGFLTAIAVGYGIDSVADVYIQKFERSAKTSLEKVTEQLSADENGSA
jgi:hypothetical protein